MFSSTALANWFLCHSWAYITETRSTKPNSTLLTNRLYLVMISYSFYIGAPLLSAEELGCLATWKEGNSRYLVAMMNHSHVYTDEARYRCFVYQVSQPISDIALFSIPLEYIVLFSKASLSCTMTLNLIPTQIYF